MGYIASRLADHILSGRCPDCEQQRMTELRDADLARRGAPDVYPDETPTVDHSVFYEPEQEDALWWAKESR